MAKKKKKKSIAESKKKLQSTESVNEKSKKDKKKILKKIFKGDKSDKNPESKENLKSLEQLAEEEETKAIELKAATAKKEADEAAKLAAKEQKKAEKLKKKSLKLDSLKFDINESQKHKIKGGLISLVGLLLLAVIGIFVLGKIFHPESLADFLPAENTIALAELNIDPLSGQMAEFNDVMKKHPIYSSENISNLLTAPLGVNFKNEIEPWMGRKLGVAFMKESTQDNSLKPVFFIESKNINLTLNFLKTKNALNASDKLPVEDYRGYQIYSIKSNPDFSFFFIKNYFTVTGSKSLTKQLVDEQVQSMGRLRDDSNYRRIADNLPQGGLVFAFANMHKLYDTISLSPAFQGRKVKDLLSIRPFLELFSAEGASVYVDDHKYKIQVFTNVDRSKLNGATYLTYNEKYEGKLLDLANESPLAFFGGHNLYKELNRTSEIFQGGTDTSSAIFDGILEAQKQKYFGTDVSLQNDIYPLLENEYLLTISNDFTDPHVDIFLSLSDKSQDVSRVEKIVQGFIKMSAIFSPQIQDVTLPDGSKGQEVVANAEQITRTDNLYDGINITSLKLGKLKWGVNYAVIDNNLIISSHLISLQNIIDRANGKNPTGLKSSTYFKDQVGNLLRTSDELWHVNLSALAEVYGLNDNKILKSYFEPFNTITMVKNYFDDGISTIIQIDVL